MEIDGGDLLPEDLLIEILSKFPVKSLMRFKCVCKSWCSLIKNPIFITTHLNNEECYLFYTRLNRSKRKYLFSLLSYETHTIIENLRFPYDLKNHYLTDSKGGDSAMDILGCCNGIICVLHHDKAIVLWNPATRKVKILPRFYSPCGRKAGKFGFGFDAKSNDYKVVHLIDLCNASKDEYLYGVEVYNLSANCWRKIDAILPGIFISSSRSRLVPHVNGKFSWYAVDKCTQCHMMLSFDMSQEEFITTPFPDAISVHEPHYSRTLMVLNESISLILYPYKEENYNFEVWVLNEYGVKESWTKLYAFGPHLRLVSPSGVWKNSHLFVGDGICERLALFNMVTQEIKDLHYENSVFAVILYYKESLIPLKGFSSYSAQIQGCRAS